MMFEVCLMMRTQPLKVPDLLRRTRKERRLLKISLRVKRSSLLKIGQFQRKGSQRRNNVLISAKMRKIESRNWRTRLLSFRKKARRKTRKSISSKLNPRKNLKEVQTLQSNH